MPLNMSDLHEKEESKNMFGNKHSVVTVVLNAY